MTDKVAGNWARSGWQWGSRLSQPDGGSGAALQSGSSIRGQQYLLASYCLSRSTALPHAARDAPGGCRPVDAALHAAPERPSGRTSHATPPPQATRGDFVATEPRPWLPSLSIVFIDNTFVSTSAQTAPCSQSCARINTLETAPRHLPLLPLPPHLTFTPQYTNTHATSPNGFRRDTR